MSNLPKISEKVGKVQTEANQNLVSVSLQFWHSGAQCLSDWNQAQLKKLRKAIEKVQSSSSSGIRTDPGLLFKNHSGASKGSGFSRPSSLPKDYTLSEIRVDGKSRLHGVLSGDTFYLVWLDRNHEVFPDGK